MHVAGRAVDDDGVAGIDTAGGVLDLADGCDAERARHDRDVRGRSAFFQHDAAQPPAVVFEQRRRSHRARHDDRVLRQPVARRRVVLAEQLVHQPVRQLVEVVQALAQIGVGRAQHAGAGVRLHALDGGLGGQAGARPPLRAGAPSRGRRRTCGRLRARRGARRRPRSRRARAARRGPMRMVSIAASSRFSLLRHVIGDEIGDDDARLVQHHMAERDALVEGGAGDVDRAAARPARACRAARSRRARPRRSSPRAPSRWSAAPLLPPRNRCAARGSAPPARRACCRRAAPARRGRSGRFSSPVSGR